MPVSSLGQSRSAWPGPRGISHPYSPSQESNTHLPGFFWDRHRRQCFLAKQKIGILVLLTYWGWHSHMWSAAATAQSHLGCQAVVGGMYDVPSQADPRLPLPTSFARFLPQGIPLSHAKFCFCLRIYIEQYSATALVPRGL